MGRFQFHTCLEPSLLWAKNPWILLYFVTKRGGKGKNWWFQFGICLGSTEKSQCCVPRPAAMRGHLEAHTELSILSQHLVAVFVLFPSGSGALWDQLPPQGFAEGNPRGYWGMQVILTHHTRNQELMLWIPLFPLSGNHPAPPPQNKFPIIKIIIRLPNEPELHCYALISC